MDFPAEFFYARTLIEPCIALGIKELAKHYSGSLTQFSDNGCLVPPGRPSLKSETGTYLTRLIKLLMTGSSISVGVIMIIPSEP